MHVFLKTLQAWQSQQADTNITKARGSGPNDGIGETSGATLQVNLDEALCDQVFATVDGDLSTDEVAQRLFQGGYISLDTVGPTASTPTSVV